MIVDCSTDLQEVPVRSETFSIPLIIHLYIEFSSIISDDLNTLEEEVGKWKEVHFEIHNQGNYLTDFDFNFTEDIENIEMRDPGEPLSLQPDERGILTLKIREKEGLGSTNDIKLMITATSMNRTSTREYSFVFRTTPGSDSIGNNYFCYLWAVIMFIIIAALLLYSKVRKKN